MYLLAAALWSKCPRAWRKSWVVFFGAPRASFKCADSQAALGCSGGTAAVHQKKTSHAEAGDTIVRPKDRGTVKNAQGGLLPSSSRFRGRRRRGTSGDVQGICGMVDLNLSVNFFFFLKDLCTRIYEYLRVFIPQV